MTRIRQDLFDPTDGFDKGRGKLVEALWYVTKCIFFLSAMPWPMLLKVRILKAFGAHIGSGVYIKPRVNIHLPWRLLIGDYAWIGEEAFILNFGKVSIGSHACISQRVMLCAGNHDYRNISMKYRNEPIKIGDGVWIGAQSFVGPGVEIGSEAVITAGSVVTKSLPPQMICSGNVCAPVRNRWKSN